MRFRPFNKSGKPEKGRGTQLKAHIPPVQRGNRHLTGKLEGLKENFLQSAYLLVYIAIMPAKVPVRLVCVALDWPTILSMAANCFW